MRTSGRCSRIAVAAILLCACGNGSGVPPGGDRDDAGLASQPESNPDTDDAGAPGPVEPSAEDTDSGSSLSSEAGIGLPEEARSDLPRTEVEPPDTEKGQLSAQLSDFAFGLLPLMGRTQSAEGNYAFSPLSLSLALSMAYAGARGNTASQMRDVLHITMPDDAYFRSLGWIDRELESRVAAAIAEARKKQGGAVVDPTDYQLSIVDAVWGDRGLPFERPYLDTLATAFGAGVRLADFQLQPESERIAINAWVSQETFGRINDLIPPGYIDGSTACVLVNALYLKLPWADPFLASDTASGTFTRSDGTTVSVPFMSFKSGSGHLEFPYAEDDNLQAVAIPLDGKELSFVVLLPKPSSSLAQLESTLSATSVRALVEQMSEQAVALKLPKFVFATPTIDVSGMLSALGMTDAFDGRLADFSGISRKALAIAYVLHKATVGVDEHGLEAAAATAVPLTWSSASDIKDINVNRPFFFGIYDRPTSTWLFLGHVVDPSR
jgi:serpin B